MTDQSEDSGAGGWRRYTDISGNVDDEDDNEIRDSIRSIFDDSNSSHRSHQINKDSKTLSPESRIQQMHKNFIIKQLNTLNPQRIQHYQIANNGEFINEHYQERKTNVIANFFKGRDHVESNHRSYFNKFDIIYEGYLYKKGSKFKFWKQSWKKRYFILRRDIHCLTFYISKEDLTLLGTIHISKELNIGYDDTENFTIFVQLPSGEKYFLKGESEMDINKWKMEIKILSKSEKIPKDWWSYLFDQSNTTASGNTKNITNSISISISNITSNQVNENIENSIITRAESFTNTLYDRKEYEEFFLPSVIREQNAANFNNFEKANTLSGFVIAVKLSHIVNEGDSIFAMVKSRIHVKSDHSQSYVSCIVSCTEIRLVSKEVINHSGIYGIDTVEDATIQFDLLQNFPTAAIGADISIYKIENFSKEHRKNIELCTFYISNNAFNSLNNTFTTRMKILNAPVLDLTNPIQVEYSATLGIIKVTSELLYKEKRIFKKIFKTNPYSQMLYSFKTIAGFTMTLEQIYCTACSHKSTVSYCDLLLKERVEDYDNIIEYILLKLAETDNYYKQIHLTYINNGRNTSTVSSELLKSSDRKDLVTHIHNSKALIIGVIDDKEKYIASVELKKNVSEKSVRLSQGSKEDTVLREGLQSIIDFDSGGTFLKRSIWRNEEDMQFVTNNLNIHVMSSVSYDCKDIKKFSDTGTDSSEENSIVISYITLGCPTAHTLKFKEGGLKSIFMLDTKNGEKTNKNIYLWIYLVQAASSADDFVKFLLKYPEEASSIFGPLDNLKDIHLVSKILKKKMSIAERLDIVTNQVLGFAVTSIKTVVSFASKVGGLYSFALARSLKIGFLISVESLLSSTGKELGMIEDIDIAIKWLKLITVRFVIEDKKTDTNDTGKDKSITLDHVVVRRDSKNRIIVDVFIDEFEAETITSAIKFMHTLSNDEMIEITDEDLERNARLIPALKFNPNPICSYSANEIVPKVIAVVQLHGCLFTQGINEMQTIANLSHSHEVLRQVEINNECLEILKQYYRNYIVTMKFQIDKLIARIDVDDINIEVNTPSPSKQKNEKINNDKRYYKVLEESMKQLQEVEKCIGNSSSSPYQKHVDILTKIGPFCSNMGSILGIMCKSGKDRTAMAVTLEMARELTELQGVVNCQRICSTLRYYGVRRINVLSNIGSSYYAFNYAQRSFLPRVYRPPKNSYKKGST